MISRTLIGSGSLLGLLALVACSGASTPPELGQAPDAPITDAKTPAKADAPASTPQPETPAKKSADEPAPPAPDAPVEPGAAGSRISVNEHCCFGGKYFNCPNTAACFGGFDVQACLSKCTDTACFDACEQKLDTAGAPKGCNGNATPPKGVDCATGEIHIGG